MLKTYWDKIPAPIKWGIIFVVILLGWLYLTKGINGISNFVFWRKANREQAAIQEKLNKAEKQQEVIDQTLKDLAVANSKLEEAKKVTDKAVEVFDDTDKTSKQKVAEFEAIMSTAPVRTDPTGVTDDQLCARAKAAGSNPDLIAALCSK